jgi:hypothetical protein
MELLPITLTAGSAKALSLAKFKNLLELYFQ